MSCAHHEFRALSDTELRAVYDQHLVPEISALVDGERDYIINLANAAAVLYHGLKQVTLIIGKCASPFGLYFS
jgi:putative methionine-R-sulfoxide reductase with GAF domain